MASTGQHRPRFAAMGKKERGREAKEKREKRSKDKGGSELQVGMAVCVGAIAVCVRHPRRCPRCCCSCAR